MAEVAQVLLHIFVFLSTLTSSQYLSTLDLELRGEDGGLDWRGLLLIATVGAYLFVPPGVMEGFSVGGV